VATIQDHQDILGRAVFPDGLAGRGRVVTLPGRGFPGTAAILHGLDFPE